MPELTTSQTVLWDVFMKLHTSRLEGFSKPAPLQISEILSCADLTYEEESDLLYCMKVLDATFFEWVDGQKNG